MLPVGGFFRFSLEARFLGNGQGGRVKMGRGSKIVVHPTWQEVKGPIFEKFFTIQKEV